MSDLKGSQYTKDGIWWVKFPLPQPVQVNGKYRDHVETSVRKWYKSRGISGKGKEGEKWAKALRQELTAKYYANERISPAEAFVTVEMILANYVRILRDEKNEYADYYQQKFGATLLADKFKLAKLTSREVTTDRMRLYMEQRILMDGVTEQTVGKEFAYLHAAWEKARTKTTPSMLTAEPPAFPATAKSQARQGHMKLDMYQQFCEASDEMYRPLWVCACHTGLRTGTLEKLEWTMVDDLYGESPFFRIPEGLLKARKPLSLPIFGDMLIVLRDLKQFRDEHFPEMQYVFFRWHRGLHRHGKAQERRRLWVAGVEHYISRRIDAKALATHMAVSERYVRKLIERYRDRGAAAILDPKMDTALNGAEPIRDVRAAWNATMKRLGWDAAYFRKRGMTVDHLTPHDCRRTALDLMKKAGYTKQECMRFMHHFTDSMFEWYGVGDDDEAVVQTAQKFTLFMNKHRTWTPPPITRPTVAVAV